MDSDGLVDSDVCHDVTSEITEVPTRVMLLEDKSQSMEEQDKWNLAKNAIEGMVREFNQDIEFGIDLFPISATILDLTCEVGESVLLDVALVNSDAIMSILDGQTPGGVTPLYLAMMNFTEANYAPIFLNGEAQSYLVIISDGEDTCGEETLTIDLGGIPIELPVAATTDQLTDVTSELLINHDIKTIVIGFGDAIDANQLNAIAAQGGTEFTQYLNASNGDELADALKSIGDKVVVSCRYDLGNLDREELNLDLVNVYFDGVAVPRDDGCQSGIGWSWIDDSRQIIEFCEQACAMLESQQVSEIAIKIMCREEKVIVI